MRLRETVQVKNNISIIGRERGKIVLRRESHNIWLDTGKAFLASLMAYSSFSPLTPERDDRIRYMGFGIGGTRQNALSFANAAPLVTAYPGSNMQTDAVTSVTRLERPVRLTGSSDPYPGIAGDAWTGQVQAPATHATPNVVTFTRVFTEVEISYTPFLSVPLSEIMLFTGAADPGVYNSVGVAYDTFDTVSKTAAIEFEATWTVRF